MNTLTLCLIARDEEHFLPGCLQSVRGLVDRIVVVDTGSQDATRELARAAGAEVLDFPWCDDFAAARNAGLARISTGFVLVLDADERLAPGSGPALRAAIRRKDFDCGLLPLHDASEAGASAPEVLSGHKRRGEPLYVPRLLRRTPDLAYQGRVHEQVSQWLERHPRLARIEVPIVHYGAVPSLRAARNKDQRNRRLLEQRAQEEPRDAQVQAYLSRELLRAQDHQGAAAAAARAFELIVEERARGQQVQDAVLPLTLHTFQLLQAGNRKQARAVLEQARAWKLEHPNVHLLWAKLEEIEFRRGEADGQALVRAEEHCLRCLEQYGTSQTSELLPGASSWSAATRLGTVRLLAGRPREAWSAFQAALEAAPEHAEALLGRAEARLMSGDAAGALVEIEAQLARPEPDAWVLAAVAAHALQHLADARLFSAEARRRRGQNRCLAEHRDHLSAALEADMATPEQALV